MSKMNNLNGSENDKIIRIPELDYTPDPRGLGHVYFTHMLKHKDKIAQIDGLTGDKETFGSLRQRCIRAAIALRSRGVTPNDIISLCTLSNTNMIVPFIASIFIGSKVASVDPSLSLPDTVFLLKQITPKIIFVWPDAVEMIEQALQEASPNTEIIVFGNTSKHTSFSDFMQVSPEENTFKPVESKNIHDTSLIFFSSGTSGLAKGICVSEFSFLNQIINTISFGFCTDVILGYASVYWLISAVYWGVSVVKGTSRLVLPKFDPSDIWWRIDKYKPTMVFVAPYQLMQMYNKGRPDGIDTSSVKDVNIGGGAIQDQKMLELRTLFPGSRVHLSYGMTEMVGFITCFNLNNPKEINFLENKPASSGLGIPGVSYKVVNPETEEILGPNQEGELRLKTNYQMNGYYKLDASDAWDSDGWIKTGDIVYYDEDRCFYILERIKEMIKYQLWHILPVQLESILLTHPDVESAVVIGIPHEVDGEHPMAVVVLSKGSEVTSDDIKQYVEKRVHQSKQLRGGVRIVDHIPTTPTGKIKRKEVKNMILNN